MVEVLRGWNPGRGACVRRPPAFRTAFVLIALAAAATARVGEGATTAAVRLQASPDFTLVLPSVEPDSVGVDLQVYDPPARTWRRWGKFNIERPDGKVPTAAVTISAGNGTCPLGISWPSSTYFAM